MSASNEGGLDQQISMAQVEDHVIGGSGRVSSMQQAQAKTHLGIKPDELLVAAHEVQSAFEKGTRAFVAMAGSEYVGPIKHVKGDLAFQQIDSKHVVVHRISDLAKDHDSLTSLGEAVLNRSQIAIKYGNNREVNFSDRSLQNVLSHAKERDLEF